MAAYSTNALAEVRKKLGVGKTTGTDSSSLAGLRQELISQQERSQVNNAPVTVEPVQTAATTQKTIADAFKGATGNPFSNPYNTPNISQTPGYKQEEKSNEYQKQFNVKLQQAGYQKIGGTTKVAGYLPTKTVDYEVETVDYSLPFYVPADTVAEMTGTSTLKSEIISKANTLGTEKTLVEKASDKLFPKKSTPKITYDQQADYVINRYFTDSDYRKKYDEDIGQQIANTVYTQEQIKSGEIDKKPTVWQSIENGASAFVNDLLLGIPTTGLVPLSQSDSSIRVPSKKQMLDAELSKSPIAQTVGSLAGSLASAIMIQGAALKAIDKGFTLSKVSLSTTTLANLNKITIGVATQIPQSIFKRDSVKQLWDEKGEIALETVRNGFSWYLGGNFERAMDNSLGKLVTSEETLTGIRKLAYAALTKTPIAYRAITESAETLGQTIGSIALGQTEYITDPSYMLQNVGMDMLMLTFSGLVGTDGTNKAAIAKGLNKIRTEFDASIKSADVESTDLVIARAKAAQQIDELVSKYDIKNQQMLQVAELSKDLLTLDVDKVQAQTTTFEESGRLSQLEQAANDDIAYKQTKELSKQEPEQAVNELKEGMVKNPPTGISKEEIQNSEFKTVRVNDNAMEFAKQMRETFGMDIIFGEYDNPKVNNSFKGAYTESNNTITINSRLTDVDALEAVISHEIIHSMKATNPDAYKALASYVDIQRLQNDPEYKKHVDQATNTTGKGENESVIDNANEEYLGDLFMAMYKLDNKFIDKAIKDDKGMVKSLLNNIKRSALIQSNTKDMPILTAFKEINGLSKAMESALYKFANEPKVKVEVKAPKVETPVVKTEPVVKKEVQPKVKAKQPSTTSQKVQQATSAVKDVKVPSEKAKTSTAATADEVKYLQESKDIMQSATTLMSYAETVDATKTAGRIKEQIGEGIYDRMIKSSKAFEQKAVDFLNDNPDKIDSENTRIVAMLESGKKIDSEGFASAIALMKHYLKTDDVKNAENIFSLYIPAMSDQGRSLQAGKLLASTTPPGYLKVVESQLRRLNESGKKKYKDKWANVELTSAERASILGTNMNDIKTRDYNLLKIGQRIAAEMPHNAGDYLNAWRKLSMLSSVRTHARNLLSNAMYVPTQKLNNAIATVLEKTIKIGTSAETTPWSVKEAVQTFGDGFKRLNKNADLVLGKDWNELTLTSKSLDAVRSTNPNRPDQVETLRTMLKEEINGQLAGKSADYFAKNKIIDQTIDNWVSNNKGIDTATRTHTLTKDAKLDQMIKDDYITKIKPALSRLNTDTVTTRNVFGAEVKPFGNKKGAQILNRISSFNSKMLNDVEDVPFYGLAYKSALNRYMKANGQTEITPVAREVAINKALEATYKQNYAFVVAMENLKKMRIGGNVVDVIMPFTRTPINIIMRGIENSPIGLGKGIFEAGKFIFGKSTAYEVNGKTRYRGDIQMLRKSIDDIASGLGGTVVVALGAMAFNAGIVTGPPEDEYKLADYRKQVGEAPYALHLGNMYFPLDWIQPTITPFVTGLAMAQSMIKSGITPDGVLKAATEGGNVVLNLPFLSTLQDLLSTNASAGSTNVVYDALGKLGTSYVSQMVPTLVGDVNRAIDNKQRSTYSPKDSSVEGDEWNGLAQKLPVEIRAPIRNIMSKVAPQLLEAKVDIWGNELKRSPNAVANAFQSMLFPFLATQDKKTAVDKELIRLSGIDPSNTQMFPKVSPKSVSNTYNGVSTQYALDSKEYAGTWQKTAGQTAYNAINTLINSSAYRSVDDTLKSKAYSMSHEYAKVKADNIILKEKGVSGIVLTADDDKIAEKLIELYIVNKKMDSGTTAINYPRTATDDIAYSGKTYSLTQTQKNNYETLLGTNTRTALSKIINSDSYQKAKPDKQLDQINKAISDSKAKTTSNFMMKYKSALTVKK